MNNETLHALQALNNDFYQANCDSFSRSRHASWPGWERVAAVLEGRASASEEACVSQGLRSLCAQDTGEGFCASMRGAGPFRVLDVACGNLRFEKYLAERFPGAPLTFTCLDSCASLAADVVDSDGVQFVEEDVLDALVQGRSLPEVKPHSFDLAVSFGFMHHVPTRALRIKLLNVLAESLVSQGVGVVSFWQFMQDPKLASKARRTTERGVAKLDVTLEEGDYLLGWNDETDVYRYCHSFEDDEITELVEEALPDGAVIDRFKADGRTKSLNTYVVFRC